MPIPNGVDLAKCSVCCEGVLVGVDGGRHGEDVKEVGLQKMSRARNLDKILFSTLCWAGRYRYGLSRHDSTCFLP